MKSDREIRQLWHTAETYFQTAQNLRDANRNHLNYKPTRIAEFYKKTIPKDQYKKDLNILLAHLSSSAIRLVTIEERFKEDHNYWITLQHERTPRKKTHSQEKLKKALLAKSNQYIHQMLRHNVAHVERSKLHGHQPLWHARQVAIESMKVEEIFSAMAAVMERFRNELVSKRIL